MYDRSDLCDPLPFGRRNAQPDLSTQVRRIQAGYTTQAPGWRGSLSVAQTKREIAEVWALRDSQTDEATLAGILAALAGSALFGECVERIG